MERVEIEIEKLQLDWINTQIEHGNIKSISEVVSEALKGLISKNKPPRNISKEKISEGISLCKKNILDLLKCSEALVNIGMSNYAIILFQFAKEETGKLALLMEKNQTTSPTISISDDVFTNHILKDKKAKEFLGNEEETWLIKGGYGKCYQHINTFKGYEMPIWTNHDVRLKCAFVDFNEKTKEWQFGINHVPETVLVSVKKVESKIKERSLENRF